MSNDFNENDSKIQYFKTPVDFSTYTTKENISDKPKSHKRIIAIAGVSALLLIGVLFFYPEFYNQTSDDTKGSMSNNNPKNLLEKYNVGLLGDDHAHAAIAVFIDNTEIDFSLDQFQIKSSYIHFENNNPYLIHRHATNVPLEMLFDSIGIEITKECIIVSEKSYCDSMKFFVNEKPYSDIASYIPNHKDRILISLGEGNDISEQLEYLKSLPIYGLPKEAPKDDSVYV